MPHTISDITFKSTVLDDDSFVKKVNYDAPEGFSPFQNFFAGDYTYKNAIFRLGMESEAGDRGIINKLQLVVDVPDIFDRGLTIVNTAGIIRVFFNRPFHIPPTMVVAVESASDACVARVVSGALGVTKTYFDCYLERTSDKAKITGALTWAAHAY
jgi:hypothetical protein